eukprot:IDg14313t1
MSGWIFALVERGSSVVFLNIGAIESEIVVYDWFDDGCASFRYKITKPYKIKRMKVSDNHFIAFKCQSGLQGINVSDGKTLFHYAVRSDLNQQFDFALARSRIVIACTKLSVRFQGIKRDDINLPDYDPPAKEAICDISADGKIVTAACSNGSFGVWSVDFQSRLLVLASTGSDPRTCSLSSNGKLIIAGYSNGQVQLFDMNKREIENNSLLKGDNAAEAVDDDIQDEMKLIAM